MKSFMLSLIKRILFMHFTFTDMSQSGPVLKNRHYRYIRKHGSRFHTTLGCQ